MMIMMMMMMMMMTPTVFFWRLTFVTFKTKFYNLFDNTWVISKVLPTVRFLFKNELILQNTFTGLQYNLRCALSQRSNFWASLVFLSGRLHC